MKKILSILLSFLLASNSWALSTTTITYKTPTNIPSSTLTKLGNIGGLTLYKDFSDGTLTPDYVNPDTLSTPVFTYTSAYDSTHPASYPSDTSGTITTPVTTANTPRFVYGFWQITQDVTVTNNGFVNTGRGLLIDGAVSNSTAYSEDFTQAGYWSKTNTTVGGSVTLPTGATGTKNVITASADGGTITAQQTVGSSVRVFYIWLKRVTGTGTVYLTLDNYGTAIGSAKFVPAPVTSDWKVFSIKTTCANPRWGIKLATNGDAVAAWGAMVAGYPFYSSYVPTTSSANLSKTGDVLKLSTTGIVNSSASTIIMQFVSLSDEFQNGSSAPVLFSMDANSPQLLSSTVAYPLKYYPNTANLATSLNTSYTGFTKGNTFTVTAVSYGATAATNSEIYINGTLQTSAAVSTALNTTNYTAPTIPSVMYIGSSYASSGTLQPPIILKKIAIFNKALSSTEVATANTALGAAWEGLIDSRSIVLTVGDSITNGSGGTGATLVWGYRAKLQELLGVGRYHFVGPFRNSDLSDSYELFHAGVSGANTTQILNRLYTHAPNYLTNAPAGSMVLIHAGTNDVTAGAGYVTPGVANVATMIDYLHANYPNVMIVVMKLIPRTDASDTLTTTYNTELTAMVQGRQATISNLHLVDQNAAFKANASWNSADADNTGPGYLPSGSPWLYVHPDEDGYQVMANTIASCLSSWNNTYCDGH